MVVLSRICTKTGDLGETGLGDGSRVSKAHPRIHACGSVDELNAWLGVVRLTRIPLALRRLTFNIQHDLFDIGADLCVPMRGARGATRRRLRVTAAYVARLEQALDQMNRRLTPARSFILPGGGSAATWLHVARTACRRAERDVVTLAESEPVNPHVIIYLNRLSDLLFVMARVANRHGRDDVLWQPGKTQHA